MIGFQLFHGFLILIVLALSLLWKTLLLLVVVVTFEMVSFISREILLENLLPAVLVVK